MFLKNIKWITHMILPDITLFNMVDILFIYLFFFVKVDILFIQITDEKIYSYMVLPVTFLYFPGKKNWVFNKEALLLFHLRFIEHFIYNQNVRTYMLNLIFSLPVGYRKFS